MSCKKRRVRFVMRSGRGWLLELETVEDGFLLKREKAIARDYSKVLYQLVRGLASSDQALC